MNACSLSGAEARRLAWRQSIFACRRRRRLALLVGGSGALAAELRVVLDLDLLPRGLVCHLVHTNRGQLAQVLRVHVRVRQQARAREDALDIRLVWNVARRLLEDDEMQREAVLQLPHHLELRAAPRLRE
jgi:hypothetical protein